MSVLKPSLPHYTAELDYVSTPVTVTFGCNQDQATASIHILNDWVQEPTEIFTVKLSTCEPNVELDEDHACIIIIDDDIIINTTPRNLPT